MQNIHYCNTTLKGKLVQNKNNLVGLNLVGLNATKPYYTTSRKLK